MASIGDLVQAKSGQMYDKDSSQGKVIVAAQKRAAASAAQSNSFSAGSSALNTIDTTPILNNIADDVEIIRNSVNQLVVIAEADARGDALGAANVTDGVPDTTMTGDMTGGGMAGGGGVVENGQIRLFRFFGVERLHVPSTQHGFFSVRPRGNLCYRGAHGIGFQRTV